MKRLLRAAGIAALVLACFAFGQQSGPLTAGFSVRPYAPRQGFEIQFRDLSAGEPVEWLWEFGDGATSSFQNPVHVYQQTGSFEVTLTVTDASGATATIERGY